MLQTEFLSIKPIQTFRRHQIAVVKSLEPSRFTRTGQCVVIVGVVDVCEVVEAEDGVGVVGVVVVGEDVVVLVVVGVVVVTPMN